MSRFGPLRLAVIALLLVVRPLQAQDDYEIGSGDVLSVVVLGQPEMSGDMAVDPDGMLTLPILGKIKASQMTTRELERKITTLLADGYLKRPEVSLAVKEYRSQRVFVMGEVQRPGPYPLKTDRSLLALLGDVGTLSPNAGHEVVVIRPPKESTVPVVEPAVTPQAPENGETAQDDEKSAEDGKNDDSEDPAIIPGAEIFHIDLDELRSGNPEANIQLRAGDTVHFPRAAQVFISGHVGHPGSFRFQRGMTLLQALTLAGGVTERGSAGRTRVLRMIDGKRKKIKVKLTDPVEPNDTIVVPERFF
ncbi:MAG: polysaccharide biosynthesis/export family protein [Vicinamibacteria bacterium]|nr:polysaccharide biosynthesis/export family protein [Vicinamibacteria bacterium]